MMLLSLSLTLLEIVILQVGALILGFTIYFFYSSRKSLQKTMEATGTPPWTADAKKTSRSLLPKKAVDAQQLLPGIRKAEVAWPDPLVPGAAATTSDNLSLHAVAGLKESLLQQQQTLTSLLQKVEELQEEAADKEAYKQENEELQQRIEEMELAMMRKEKELAQVRQQEAIAQQMATRIDEVYKEFDLLQHKITTLEAQAARSGSLSLELEDLQFSYQKLSKELSRKQQQLDEAVSENQRLRTELAQIESKLGDVNIQRQQLAKRTQLLQDANEELSSVADSQSKLQKELRRIGELESMLSLMAEERANLLDRHKK